MSTENNRQVVPEQSAANSSARFTARLTQHSAVRYLLVGGFVFLIDVGLLWVFQHFLSWPLWLASGASFLIGFLFSYTLQRAFSFSSNIGHGQGLLRYIALLAFNTLATMLIVELVGATTIGWVGAKVFATVITTVWSYFAYRWWVFPAQHSLQPPDQKPPRD